MAITDYDSLKTAISGWLADEDLDDFIDDFIDACEDRMLNELRIRELLVHDTAFAISDGDRILTLPSAFNVMKYFRVRMPTTVGSSRRFYPPLKERTVEQLTELSVSLEGPPQNFCVHTGIELDYEADQNYTAELLYYKKFDRLNDSDTTNEIITNYPSLYLWGSLAASAMYLQHDERVPVWVQAYDSLKNQLNRTHAIGNFAGPLIPRLQGGLPRGA